MMPRGQRDELVRHPQGQVEGSASHARRATDAGRGTHREIRAAQKPKEMNGSKPRSPPTLKLASELFHVKKQIIKALRRAGGKKLHLIAFINLVETINH